MTDNDKATPTTAHTPGPLDWMFVGAEANGHVYLIDANNRKIASMWGKGAEKIANANLFAAAPDMLAALKAVEEALLYDAAPPFDPRNDNRIYQLDGGILGNALSKVRAAIAKAAP